MSVKNTHLSGISRLRFYSLKIAVLNFAQNRFGFLGNRSRNTSSVNGNKVVEIASQSPKK